MSESISVYTDETSQESPDSHVREQASVEPVIEIDLAPRLNDFHKGICRERGISMRVAGAAGLFSREVDSEDYKEWLRTTDSGRAEAAGDELHHKFTLPVAHMGMRYPDDPITMKSYFRVRYDETTFDAPIAMGKDGLPDTEKRPCPRYQCTGGVPVRPYIPAFFSEALAKEVFRIPKGSSLFFSEAPLKCLSLYSHGFPGVGLGGVLAGAHLKQIDKSKDIVAHPELARLNLPGVNCYTVFDAGQARNPTVALGVARLWKVLQSLEAVVHTVTIPEVEKPKDGRPESRDQGPDDFIVKYGKEKFQELVDAAYLTDPIERVIAVAAIESVPERKRATLALGRDLIFRACLYLLDNAGLTEIVQVSNRTFTSKALKDLVDSFRASMKQKDGSAGSEADPLKLVNPSNADVARVLIARIAAKFSPSLTDAPEDRVVGDLGAVWAYDEKTGVWLQMNDNDLSREIQAMDGVPVKGTDKRWYIQSTGAALEMARSRVDRPKFFADAPMGKGFRNGFAVPEEGLIVIKPHALANKIRHAYSFDYDDLPDGVRLRLGSEYITSALRGTEDIQEKINMLMAHAGLCLLGQGTWPNAAIMLYDDGRGGTGKSVWLELVGAMFEDSLKTAVSPQQMCDGGRSEYYRDTMARAHINILSEVPSTELVSGEFIRSIFDGNLTSCRAPCGKPYFRAMTLGQLYSCNGLFAVKDPCQAFFDRFILVEFRNRFRKTSSDKGKNYWKRIRDAELPQLISLCLAHAARVLQEDAFPIPQSCLKALDQWRTGCNAVEQCLIELTVPVAEERQPFDGTNKEALWVVFKDWSERTKQSTKMGRKLFWERLTALVGEPRSYENRNAYPFRLKTLDEMQPPHLKVVDDVETVLANV